VLQFAGVEIDCHQSVHSIPGDINLINRYAYQTDAQHVLVIEKDAVFQVSCLVVRVACCLGRRQT
jgi:DNA topoisomerase VI subunit A